MIEVVNEKDTKKKIKFNLFLRSGCSSCTRKSSNIISIRQDNGTGGTLIALCDDCLLELKRKIEELELEENDKKF